MTSSRPNPPVIAGDIGGTKVLLRLVVSGDDAPPVALHQARFSSGDYPEFSAILTEFLAGVRQHASPEFAVFGVAGPVVDGACRTTNLPWELSEESLAARHGLREVRLLNDFEASAHGVMTLRAGDFETLQAGVPSEAGVRAVIGAGTGLGEAVIVCTDPERRSANPYCVVPTEGAHADFAPRDDIEIELHRYLRERYGRVSWERVVSGPGIVNIYEFLRDSGMMCEDPEVAREISIADVADAPSVIGVRALAGSDPMCARAVDLFLASYGAEVGNLALRTLATGGIFLTGGILPKLRALLPTSRFMSSILAKGRLSNVVRSVPIHIALDEQLGLMGAVAIALRLRARAL